MTTASPSARPLVSVIVPAYNAARTIARAIDSVLAQTVPESEVEIIVCDDGSTDETADILAGYGRRLIVVRQENRGRGAARNACVARATATSAASRRPARGRPRPCARRTARPRR